MNKIISKLPALFLTLVVGVMASSTAFAQATIVIENADAADTGFNDPTPATSVGGNSGTTIGQQRLNAFQHAANIWGATLPGGPTITVRASWEDQACEANTGTLGSAGSMGLVRDFPNAPVANTWFGSALANTLAGFDLDPANPEIRARFNKKLGTPGCMENLRWYYGFQTNSGSGGVNLVTVLLHEFAHGLGFQSFTSSSTGAQIASQNGERFPSTYDRFLFDNTTNKNWTQMTDAERVASAINTGNLVWTGPQVHSDKVLVNGKDAHGHPAMFAPNPIKLGSSVSHWDTTASPNQLMEPNISNNLSHSVTVPQDLTLSLLWDIGWCGLNCPPPPSPTPTLPPPANDNFANAQVITGCSGTVAGTNNGATKEAGEPTHFYGSSGSKRSVWYQWQALATGFVTVNTTGSSFDTILAVYAGDSFSTLFSGVNNDDESPTVTTSTVTFHATEGLVVKFAIDGYNNSGLGGDTGNLTLNWNQSNCFNGTTDQTISFSPLPDRTFGDAPFPLTASASSGLPVTFTILSGPAVISGNTITHMHTGVITVRASQAGDATYKRAPPVDRTFTATKANQTINFPPISDKTYGGTLDGDGYVVLTASSTSGHWITYSVLSGPGMVGGNSVSIMGAGVITIRASQPGNNFYNPALDVDRSFTVSKGNQAITFFPLPDRNYGDEPFVVGASTTSMLRANFSIVSGPATITRIDPYTGAATVALTGPGVVTIRAWHAGNQNYNPATPVDQTFTVGNGPLLLLEEGTTRAIALDAVTLSGGPFSSTSTHNFSVDKLTRVMLLTTNLGLNNGDDLSRLSVNLQGTQLQIEAVGSLQGMNQISFIVVKLPAGLTPGEKQLNFTLRGVTSNTATISISP